VVTVLKGMTLVEYPGISTPRSSSVVDNVLTVDQMTALENSVVAALKRRFGSEIGMELFHS